MFGEPVALSGCILLCIQHSLLKGVLGLDGLRFEYLLVFNLDFVGHHHLVKVCQVIDLPFLVQELLLDFPQIVYLVDVLFDFINRHV